MGSSNPVNKIEEGFKDAIGSIEDDPLGTLTSALSMGTSGFNEVYETGTRAREDQRDQAAGMAEKEQNRAAAAESRAIDASVKETDAIALERRRRAAVATNNGRSGTILTSGTSLGSADVARKTLLGM